jgi:hypothetical protein
VSNGTFATPSPTASSKHAAAAAESTPRLLLFLRMPINQRWQVDLPSPDGEQLELYHVSNQVLCHAVTDGVFVRPRARTGYLYVRRFASLGQVPEPAIYEAWLRRSAREPGTQWF